MKRRIKQLLAGLLALALMLSVGTGTPSRGEP